MGDRMILSSSADYFRKLSNLVGIFAVSIIQAFIALREKDYLLALGQPER